MVCESCSAIKSEVCKKDLTPLLWVRTRCCRDSGTGNGFQASVWKLRHWRAIVAWSLPAELLKILVFHKGEQKSRTHTMLDTKPNESEFEQQVTYSSKGCQLAKKKKPLISLRWFRLETQKKRGHKIRSTLLPKLGCCWQPSSRKLAERHFVIDSGASMRKKKGLELKRVGYSQEIQNFHNSGNSQWRGPDE